MIHRDLHVREAESRMDLMVQRREEFERAVEARIDSIWNELLDPFKAESFAWDYEALLNDIPTILEVVAHARQDRGYDYGYIGRIVAEMVEACVGKTALHEIEEAS